MTAMNAKCAIQNTPTYRTRNECRITLFYEVSRGGASTITVVDGINLKVVHAAWAISNQERRQNCTNKSRIACALTKNERKSVHDFLVYS